jgi:hypothetical protein
MNYTLSSTYTRIIVLTIVHVFFSNILFAQSFFDQKLHIGIQTSMPLGELKNYTKPTIGFHFEYVGSKDDLSTSSFFSTVKMEFFSPKERNWDDLYLKKYIAVGIGAYLFKVKKIFVGGGLALEAFTTSDKDFSYGNLTLSPRVCLPIKKMRFSIEYNFSIYASDSFFSGSIIGEDDKFPLRRLTFYFSPFGL